MATFLEIGVRNFVAFHINPVPSRSSRGSVRDIGRMTCTLQVSLSMTIVLIGFNQFYEKISIAEVCKSLFRYETKHNFEVSSGLFSAVDSRSIDPGSIQKIIFRSLYLTKYLEYKYLATFSKTIFKSYKTI